MNARAPAPRLATVALVALACAAAACRVEWVSPGTRAGASSSDGELPSGDVWVYTSMYRHVVDRMDTLVKERLPSVQVHWFQSGSEKVASRLDAELSAGGTPADLLMTSDPFFYERLKREGHLARHVSPDVLKFPRSLLDLDGFYVSCRHSTMVLVHRADLSAPPTSFAELTSPRWRGEVALGDPLTSGTALTWAVFMDRKLGEGFFRDLRANGAVVAGGNAAVLQKVASGEAKVGTLLLENALTAIAQGSPLRVKYPDDGAVIVPGYLAVLNHSRNPRGARAVFDLLLSPDAQRLVVSPGDMHAANPELPGPRGEPSLAQLLERAQPWDEALRAEGAARAVAVKQRFTRAFSR